MIPFWCDLIAKADVSSGLLFFDCNFLNKLLYVFVQVGAPRFAWLARCQFAL